MKYMTRRYKYLTVAVYLTVGIIAGAVSIAYQDMPALLLSLTGAVGAGCLGTAVLVAWKVEVVSDSREDPREKQMQILLEDATRLRTQSEKLHRDVLYLMGMPSRGDGPHDAPESGAEAAGTA